MKTKMMLAISAMVTLGLTACNKNDQLPNAKTSGEIDVLKSNDNSPGVVYTVSNQMTGNKILVYNRSSNGNLTFSDAVSTGGNGTGGGLGNQGATVISADGKFLLAVNAGSNSISSFRIAGAGLQLVSTVPSGGNMPVSITQAGSYVYVLNAGVPNNVHGFKLHDDGMLTMLYGSSRPLSSDNTAPAQISFVNNGTALVISEKATNKLLTYTVDGAGMPGMMHYTMSAHPTPFGFAKGAEHIIFVSEAAGGAPGISKLSSYKIAMDGTISLADGPVGAGQTAACWVAINNSGKYAYTTNTGDNSISCFGIAKQTGSIAVKSANAAMSEGGPIDAAFSNGSKYFYVLNGAGHTINAYSVANDGSLEMVGQSEGLPMGATGLAAK